MKQKIIDSIVEAYLSTGSAARISDIAKQLGTSSAKVREAAWEVGFDFSEEAFPSGQFSNFTGKTVLSPVVEPSKRYLAGLIKAQGA